MDGNCGYLIRNTIIAFSLGSICFLFFKVKKISNHRVSGSSFVAILITTLAGLKKCTQLKSDLELYIYMPPSVTLFLTIIFPKKRER